MFVNMKFLKEDRIFIKNSVSFKGIHCMQVAERISKQTLE